MKVKAFDPYSIPEKAVQILMDIEDIKRGC